MLAPEYFANLNSKNCIGDFHCHWCAAPCAPHGGVQLTHDKPPPIIGVKTFDRPRYPGCPYICIGCWLLRLKRTIDLWNGKKVDSQTLMKNGWLMTDAKVTALPPCSPLKYPLALYETLLHPPKRFALYFLDPAYASQGCLPHHCQVNNNATADAGTEYHFVINHTPLTYRPYELESALRNGSAGTDPGVREIVSRLGPYSLPPLPEEKGRGPETGSQKVFGRPAKKGTNP